MTKQEAINIINQASQNINITNDEKAKVLEAIQVLAGSWIKR